MENCKTLREVCNLFEISRRVVQGYEKVGLVSASETNKYGHLLYDRETQERISQIWVYKQLGLKIKEICEVIDAPDFVRKKAIESQIVRLKKEQKQLQILIEKVMKW